MRYLIAAALFATVSSAAAQVYRWTDSSGKTHFTDTPPPASAKEVRKRANGSAQPEDADNAPEPYALQHARKTHPVKLYTAPGCGSACDEARALLNARGVPFTEVSASNELAIAELKEASGASAVPVLIVGSSVHKGFEPGMFQRSLDAAGYPKTGVLPRRNQAEPKLPEPAENQPVAETASPKGPYAPRSR
jgi:hypothetical protein